jgi:hypothetical protein
VKENKHRMKRPFRLDLVVAEGGGGWCYVDEVAEGVDGGSS